MAIPVTRLWAAGETLTAANLIRYINNVVNALAGRSGPVQIENSLEIIAGADGNRYFRLPGGTTAQRPGVPAESMIRYNTTRKKAELYDGTSWEEIGTDIPEPPDQQDLSGYLTQQDLNSYLKYDRSVTHGTITNWGRTTTSRIRVVLGHDIGRPPIGFSVSLLFKRSVDKFRSGHRIIIPKSQHPSGLGVSYSSFIASPSNSTCVFNWIRYGGNTILVVDRDDNTTSFSISDSDADIIVDLWG